MTTSRQAYRLGTRLGLGRLQGFYLGHIGFYLGQLHFYHTAWGLSAVAFVGGELTVRDPPTIEGPVAVLFALLCQVGAPLYWQ